MQDLAPMAARNAATKRWIGDFRALSNVMTCL
jgi:hypothetical protein